MQARKAGLKLEVNMNREKNNKMPKLSIISVLIFIFGFANTVWGISTAEKAKEKMEENRKYIYAVEVPMKNFGTDEQKNEYMQLKNQYMVGLSYYMQADYLNSYKELLETQKKLDKLYEKLTMDYIERTNKILQELVKTIVEIDIKYNRNSDLVARYLTDIQPPEIGGKKAKEQFYSPKETKDYHLVYDKRTIYRNVDKGFEYLGHAKRVRANAVDMEAKKYEDGQVVDPSIFSYRLDNYINVITLCREAKKNAFRAYRLINRNDIYPVQSQYRDNRFAKESHLLPVFDPRIPDQYKKDASDALNLVHQDEIDVKLNRTGHTGGDSDASSSSTTGSNQGSKTNNKTK